MIAISRYDSGRLLEGYRISSLSIATIASHSALDVFDGAKDVGFNTIAVCEVGREKTYIRFSRVVDEVVLLRKFSDVLDPGVVSKLRERSAVFIPNRSFAVYVGYSGIEEGFPVPIFGNRYLLRYEERAGEKTYYKLLDEAGIRRPKVFKTVDEVDRPVIVKIPHARKRVERGFFVASDRDDLKQKLTKLAGRGIVREEDMSKASIEELIVGAHFNVNYFYSVARDRVELLSIDRRIQTSLDGLLKLPASVQLEIEEFVDVEMIEIGHEPATIRESVLEKLFEIGDRFTEAARRIEPPGVVGPFTLQLIITKDMEAVVFDVALRIGGGTNIYMGLGSQYSKLYFGRPVSMGWRIAEEIRECVEKDCLHKVVT
ncbi:MAG: formate--phosphoribosylaminoimidazolecarboxamide ligase family protein [Sulfolobales archaeon]|nr:formate--phosphoribosylaminoimidazolecarboxamide ligase family protein [Sulfolobales archaeon]MDW8082878.1 formate--phosphoribosylaminoimidazolecarboxamide ligase family protein [Sulfolobales archaeon]